jgi:coenzyme F420 hydrogenase subunit beta
MSICAHLVEYVIKPGLCTGCGACVALAPKNKAKMIQTARGPVPEYSQLLELPELAMAACPGKGVNYPALYMKHFGSLPNDALLGCFTGLYVGFSADPEIRAMGASGGVLTQALMFLLETGRIDGAILARQGRPTPLEARAFIAKTTEEIRACAQSVYIPVSMLDILREIEPGKRYAMTCLPEQSSALRMLQYEGFAPARQIRYVFGPYTGTALEPAALHSYMCSKRIRKDDPVTALHWRAGEWPGYLEITTASGRVVRTPKVYYNYLIPFYITQTSLQSMDFSNEFTDLSVGDAWSPALESKGGGHSVIVVRSEEIREILHEMLDSGKLSFESIEPVKAAGMHGHMLDFKKRGGYLRNEARRRHGKPAPDYGYRPSPLPSSRKRVETIISALFTVGRTRPARWLIAHIPEMLIGPVFNAARLTWKRFSRPVKRRGLKTLRMIDGN